MPKRGFTIHGLIKNLELLMAELYSKSTQLAPILCQGWRDSEGKEGMLISMLLNIF